MNIQIQRISNGWVLSVVTPKGPSAIYCNSFDEVLKELSDLNDEMKNPAPNVTPISTGTNQ